MGVTAFGDTYQNQPRFTVLYSPFSIPENVLNALNARQRQLLAERISGLRAALRGRLCIGYLHFPMSWRNGTHLWHFFFGFAHNACDIMSDLNFCYDPSIPLLDLLPACLVRPLVEECRGSWGSFERPESVAEL